MSSHICIIRNDCLFLCRKIDNMSNHITLKIGERNPYSYSCRLHDELHGLYIAAKDKAWFGEKDFDLMLFLVSFFSKMNQQRPPNIPYPPNQQHSISIHIGSDQPHWYWEKLHSSVRVLYDAASKNGWIGGQSQRDRETDAFFLDFFSRMHLQKPSNVSIHPE